MVCQSRRKSRDPSSSRCCWAGSGKVTGKRWNNCFRWSTASCTVWRSSALRRDRGLHTLQPTALLNEAFLRSVRPAASGVLRSRAFPGSGGARDAAGAGGSCAHAGGAQAGSGAAGGVAGESGVERARRRRCLELDQALGRLGQEDPRLVRLIEMRFFAGMTAEETAEATRESVHLVRHDLRYAQARLRRLMVGRGR